MINPNSFSAWDIIIAFIVANIVIFTLIIFFITTVTYLTYRFWKFILPKEENNIYISNAPMVWYKQYDLNIKNDKKIEKENFRVEWEKNNIEFVSNIRKVDNFIIDILFYLTVFAIWLVTVLILYLNFR